MKAKQSNGSETAQWKRNSPMKAKQPNESETATIGLTSYLQLFLSTWSAYPFYLFTVSITKHPHSVKYTFIVIPKVKCSCRGCKINKQPIHDHTSSLSIHFPFHYIVVVHFQLYQQVFTTYNYVIKLFHGYAIFNFILKIIAFQEQ